MEYSFSLVLHTFYTRAELDLNFYNLYASINAKSKGMRLEFLFYLPTNDALSKEYYILLLAQLATTSKKMFPFRNHDILILTTYSVFKLPELFYQVVSNIQIKRLYYS